MNKIIVLTLASGVLTCGIAIVTKKPLDDPILGWIWIVWGLLTIINALLDKKAKWWA